VLYGPSYRTGLSSTQRAPSPAGLEEPSAVLDTASSAQSPSRALALLGSWNTAQGA